MALTLYPVLQTLRDLLDIPRGPARFEEYLRLMTNGTDYLLKPFTAFNPMSKDHVRVVLDQLIRLDAEKILADTIAGIPTEENFKAALVVADDAAGGWTCRETIEIGAMMGRSNAPVKQGWLTVLWWSSDEPTVEKLKQTIKLQVHKILHYVRHGPRKTLGEILTLEREAFVAANGAPTTSPPQWKTQFENHQASTEMGTIIACLYGDDAAEKLGYEKLGFPPNAGRILAACKY